MNQSEILELINTYNSTDRITIKVNLRRLMTEYNIKSGDIIFLGFKPNNVYSWANQASNNIPIFEFALRIATRFNFDMKEYLKEIEK